MAILPHCTKKSLDYESFLRSRRNRLFHFEKLKKREGQSKRNGKIQKYKWVEIKETERETNKWGECKKSAASNGEKRRRKRYKCINSTAILPNVPHASPLPLSPNLLLCLSPTLLLPFSLCQSLLFTNPPLVSRGRALLTHSDTRAL